MRIGPRTPRSDAVFQGRLHSSDQGTRLVGVVHGHAYMWPSLIAGVCAVPILQIAALLPTGDALDLMLPLVGILWLRIGLSWLLARAVGAAAIGRGLSLGIESPEGGLELTLQPAEVFAVAKGPVLIDIWLFLASVVAIAMIWWSPLWWRPAVQPTVANTPQVAVVAALGALFAVSHLVASWAKARSRGAMLS